MSAPRVSVSASRRLQTSLAGALLLQGCSGRQSALDPAGRGAEQIAELYNWMAAGAVIVWLAMIALTIYALRESIPHKQDKATLLIIGGGAAVPTLILAGLLVYGLSTLRSLTAPTPSGALQVAVSGEQWWWRVRYLVDGKAIELANEIRLPVGKPVEFQVSSFDVVHSFWIPSLGPKMDMIPGRTNRLVLHPTRTGTFRGVCAEYCGESHALVAFDVVVLEKGERRGRRGITGSGNFENRSKRPVAGRLPIYPCELVPPVFPKHGANSACHFGAPGRFAVGASLFR